MTYICGTYLSLGDILLMPYVPKGITGYDDADDLSLQNMIMYPHHDARMSPRMIFDIRHEVLTMTPCCLVYSCQCSGEELIIFMSTIREVREINHQSTQIEFQKNLILNLKEDCQNY
jgi:hypothetical protein